MIKVEQPVLLLDKVRCLSNIERMVKKARKSEVSFRPHFKTHQSRTIGRWFREWDIHSITVSSVSMAKYFSQDGWDDITIAFPVNLLEIDAINELAAKIKLNLLVESTETVEFLGKHLNSKAAIFIKVDTGNHRTGISAGNTTAITRILSGIESYDPLDFKGFLAHSGETYRSDSIDEVKQIFQNSTNQLLGLKKFFGEIYRGLIISVGDTPSCSVLETFEGVDEIRPGNFVFYDLMQAQVGVCSKNQIAVAVACPVVAKHSSRSEIVVYCGAIHLSKDYISDKETGKAIFGQVVELKDNHWSDPVENAYVKSVSQEHGIIKLPGNSIDKYKIGDVIGILPVHSCLTAEAMRYYITTEEERIDHFSGSRLYV